MSAETLRTRGELADAIASRVQDTSTSRRTQILSMLDQGYRRALNRHYWPQLVRYADAAVTVAKGETFFSTPKDVRNVLRILDDTTPFVLSQFSAEAVVDMTQGFVEVSGQPAHFFMVGEYGANQPVTDQAVEVVSDGTDTRTYFVRGIGGDGEPKTSTGALTSASAVSLGTWDEIEQFYVTTTDSSRTVTLRKGSGGATLATLAPGEREARYRRYRLMLKTPQAVDLTIIYRSDGRILDSESHRYPIPIEDYLIEFGVAKVLESLRQWSPAKHHMAQAEEGLVAAIVRDESERIHLSAPMTGRSSGMRYRSGVTPDLT